MVRTIDSFDPCVLVSCQSGVKSLGLSLPATIVGHNLLHYVQGSSFKTFSKESEVDYNVGHIRLHDYDLKILNC